MDTQTTQRQPHAVLDLPSRVWKGMKIERLLGLAQWPRPIRMLEIGTGSGGIAHYFATQSNLDCLVTAVDVQDNRLVTHGFDYQTVSGVALPFPDASFDVVLTNHVIEHVGDAQAQHEHLREVKRVMAPGGVGYLAVPNRWMLVEPHYKLMFLSWWPHAWRTPYLSLMRKGQYYDCEPLQLHQLERMLETTGFHHRNLCIEAIRATFDIEKPNSSVTRLLNWIPDRALVPMRRIIPTLIYSIEHQAA